MIKFPPGGGMPLSSVATLRDHVSFDSTDKDIRHFIDYYRKLAIQRWAADEDGSFVTHLYPRTP